MLPVPPADSLAFLAAGAMSPEPHRTAAEQSQRLKKHFFQLVLPQQRAED